jgi:hypothetical protein
MEYYNSLTFVVLTTGDNEYDTIQNASSDCYPIRLPVRHTYTRDYSSHYT